MGIPMGIGIDDTIGNGNGKECESRCMGMGMALMPMGINSHRRTQCLVYYIMVIASGRITRGPEGAWPP